MKQTKRGFTIVELVIVIAVIAILAAVLIPTFAGLIEKANESVDMQLVNQMNTVLQADEVVAGKPATVAQAQKILIENGCDDFTPTDKNNVFYWVGAENRVIIWTKDEGAETGKVTHPKEYADKYSGITTPSADWSDLSIEYAANVVEVVVEEGETIKEALIDAIKEAADGAILQLPEDVDLNLYRGGLYWLGEAMRMNGSTGKHLTIDLNGNTITSSGSNAVFTRTEDGTGWLKEEDGDYVMNILTVPENGELILTNGKLDIQHGNQPALASIMTSTGSKLVLRDMEINTTTAGVMPAGDAAEVVIENTTVNALNYALGTNRMESSNIRIVINNSNLSVTHSTAVLINTNSDTHIYNSTITGVVHAIALRAGHLELKDSTLITTDDQPGIYAYDNFAAGYGFNGYWGTGNTMPGGTLVVGDFAKANPDGSYSYSGDAVVTMINTKLQSAASDKVPEILLASSDASKTVSVTYDEASVAGTAVAYGTIWNPTSDNVSVSITNVGTITVNGVAKN